ncbi:MAG TPA: M48 family metalloprotease [Puia sp.]|nr:M48 family metalloprotease [Puia sp.]
MCRWVYNFLVLVYVVMTSVTLVVLLIVAGVHLSDGVRLAIFAGWIAICLGGVFLAERLIPFVWPGYRRPILAEEERLDSLMREVQRRTGSKMRIRFVICGDAERPTQSLGYRTVVIQSGSLPLVSDGELKGILAHELGHLRDGDRVMEAAFVTAGLFSAVFRWWCRLVRPRFGSSVILRLLLMLAIFLLALVLLPFYLVDGVFRLIAGVLRRQIEYRQDRFAFKAGFGDGLRVWLTKSGLAAQVSRIRRLEKMA